MSTRYRSKCRIIDRAVDRISNRTLNTLNIQLKIAKRPSIDPIATDCEMVDTWVIGAKVLSWLLIPRKHRY